MAEWRPAYGVAVVSGCCSSSEGPRPVESGIGHEVWCDRRSSDGGCSEEGSSGGDESTGGGEHCGK